MHWPVQRTPVSNADVPFFNLQYLHGCETPADPTMVWGSEVDVENLENYVRARNADSQILLSPAHVLLQAVGRALAMHIDLNRRVIGRRVYEFSRVNILTSLYSKQRRDVDVVVIKDADLIALDEIARVLWKASYEAMRDASPMARDKRRLRRLPGWLLGRLLRTYLWLDRHVRLPIWGRIDRLRSGPVLVNYLSFHGIPPLLAYKPAVFPTGSWMLNVTMGPAQQKPVVQDGQIVVRPMAPLFVRADHRTADAYLLGQFVSSLRNLLADPAQMELHGQEGGGQAPERRSKTKPLAA